MIHRMLRYPGGWEWHVVQQAKPQPTDQKPLPSRKSAARSEDGEAPRTVNRLSAQSEEKASTPEDEAIEMKKQFPECAGWVDECLHRRTNHISVEDVPGLGSLLSGTLMIQVSKDQSDMQPLHFWLTDKRLITMHEDLRIPLRLQYGSHTHKYDECDLAPEAFFIMISVLLESFHTGLDGFERRLGELESSMRSQNRTDLLDVIIERRYDLLHWSHLFIPIRELHVAAKESFPEQLAEKDAFVRITHKLERIETLLKHYALEIDTLISMDDAISGFRGNDIMKTLTIFTVLCLPASVFGALLGTNFDKLPFKTSPWAFSAMVTVVAVLTVFIYMWLWKKGWTGDILNKRGAPVILDDKSEQESRSFRHGKRSKRRINPSENDNPSIDQPLLRSRRNRT